MLFRNDDVCFNFNYDKYAKIREIFEEFNIKEHYSVIPFGTGIYTPKAHLIPRHEIEQFLGDDPVDTDEKADKFIKESLERGHKIALHGWQHVLATYYSYNEQLANIKRGKDFLEKKYKVTIEYFSPPFNTINEDTVNACNILGMKVLAHSPNQLERIVCENGTMDYNLSHCWYHAWRFFENNLTPEKLKLWLQQHNNPQQS